MIWGITLILLSIVAVPSLILSKKPNAKELLEKVEPYQGWIGLVNERTHLVDHLLSRQYYLSRTRFYARIRIDQ